MPYAPGRWARSPDVSPYQLKQSGRSRRPLQWRILAVGQTQAIYSLSGAWPIIQGRLPVEL
ncbi:hypothetical protein [Vacuolonema iberomarrocanum]|uniref:hypothetical protein n=1 Tax=Vacuolonema iberomarrocanum TaxID=3454632 RepID=UPI001A0F2278|nr:hypothetical protein [filamentous cyanobacterium LEGE 07170]